MTARIVVGIDVGWSRSNLTSALCALRIDDSQRTLELVSGGPVRFGTRNADATLSLAGCDLSDPISVIAVDAPITPKRLSSQPRSGRMIDRRFSRSDFSNGSGGPQPGSIAVPCQGWPLYCAGMDLIARLNTIHPSWRYHSFTDFPNFKAPAIVECIPKLTQALLVPRELVKHRDRKRKIDDVLFPPLVSTIGLHHGSLVAALAGYRFGPLLSSLVDRMASSPAAFHEELAALVAALQAAMLDLRNATIVGCDGDYEGYYALPRQADWHQDWQNVFANCARNSDVVCEIPLSAQ